MSKSVLVMDTPEDCGKCKFISDFWCRAIHCRRKMILTIPMRNIILGIVTVGIDV